MAIMRLAVTMQSKTGGSGESRDQAGKIRAWFQYEEMVAPASGRLVSGVTPETVGRSSSTKLLDPTRQSSARNPAGRRIEQARRLFHQVENAPGAIFPDD